MTVKSRAAAGLHDRWDVIKLLRWAKPVEVIGAIVATVVAALAPPAMAVALGGAITRALNRIDGEASQPSLVQSAMVLVALVVLDRVAAPVVDVLRLVVSRTIDGRIRRRLASALANSPTTRVIESASIQSRLALVGGGLFGTAGESAFAAISIAGRYLQALAAAAIVGWFSPLLGLLLFGVVVGIRWRWHRLFSELAGSLIELSGSLRRSDYFRDLLLEPTAAAEVRVFGLARWFGDLQRSEWLKATDASFALRKSLRRRANLHIGVLTLVYLVVAISMVRSAVRGEVDLGLVVAVLQAQFIASALVAPTYDDFTAEGGAAALRAVDQIEAEVHDGSAAGVRPLLPAEAPGRSIELEGVRIRHPGRESAAIDGIDLSIQVGRSTAIVGSNGAGKTTLVKALAGLIPLDGGRILVDGVDLAGVDLSSWRRRVSAVFQDFVRYPMTARENVGFGDLDVRENLGALERAADAAGALHLIRALPEGWDTELGVGRQGSVDLSGGQWQRVAVARALLGAARGGLVILDEPTANLDVRAERDLFDRLLEATRGSTIVLVSHRMASVRRADHIVVLDAGVVVEQGSHADLLAADGAYARMFRAQADAFVGAGNGGKPT